LVKISSSGALIHLLKKKLARMKDEKRENVTGMSMT